MTTATSPLQQLNYSQHGKTKIKRTYNLSHIKNQQILPVIIHEFSQAASEMPIVFIKHENDQFQPVALLGLKSGENLFYSEDKWLSGHLPAAATHYPFVMIPAKDDATKLQVFIRDSEDIVSEEEGDALFDDKGNQTEYMKRRIETLGRYYESSQLTRGFTQLITEKGLLTEQPLTVDIKGQKSTINGIYLVDEKKLNELSDEDFLEIRKRGFLGPIYCHMTSLRTVSKLAKLKGK